MDNNVHDSQYREDREFWDGVRMRWVLKIDSEWKIGAVSKK